MSASWIELVVNGSTVEPLTGRKSCLSVISVHNQAIELVLVAKFQFLYIIPPKGKEGSFTGMGYADFLFSETFPTWLYLQSLILAL